LSITRIAGIVCIIAFTLFGHIAWADDLPVYLRSTRVWDSTNGLPHNTAQSITQTADGYLWVATWEGLARFNGREWKVFDRDAIPGLSDNGIRALLAGKDGRLWVGSARDGLFNYFNGKWTAIPYESEPGQSQITALFEDKQQRIWIAAASQTIMSLEPNGSLKRYPLRLPDAKNSALGFEQDRKGDIWLATRVGLAKLNKDHFELAPVFSMPIKSVSALAKDIDGNLLAVTDHGLFKQNKDQFVQVPGGEELGGRHQVESVLVESADRIMFGTQSEGLFCLCRGQLESFNTKNGLVNNRIATLFLDQEKSLWIGTNLGVTRLRVGQITRYARYNGLSDDYVRAVLKDSDGSTWVGTSAGLNHIENNKIQQLSRNQGLPSDSIYSLMQRKPGELWVGTADAGIGILQNGKFRTIGRDQGLPSNQVRALVADGDRIWAGLGARAGGGVALIENERVAELYGTDLAVRALFLDSKKRLWIGTTSGIYYIEHKLLTQWKNPSVNLQYAFSFYEDERGVLWVAADNGLYRIENDQVTSIGLSRGIPNVPILGVVGKNDSLWICSNKGVVHLNRTQLDGIALGTEKALAISAMDQSQGPLARLQCNGGGSPVMLLDSRYLWFSTASGLALMDLKKQQQAVSNPRTLIESIAIDGIPVTAMPTIASKRQASFGPGVRRIDFVFAAPTFVAPEQVQYRVRLDGFDEAWQTASSLNRVSYTNLVPAKYTLNLEADDGFGQWSGKVTQYRFEVKPYLWQRTGFWIVLIALFSMGIFAAYRYAVTNARSREKDLENIVSERTGEIQNYANNLEKISQERENLLGVLQKQTVGLAKLASEDALTGLANRRSLELSYKELFEQTRKEGRPISVAVADIDLFKSINDSFGHHAGDDVICQVAIKLKQATRGRDLVARIGGDEFVLIFPSMSAQSTAEICDRLCRDIAALDFASTYGALKITMSIGVSDCPTAASLERLIADADRALYEAKNSGRNRVVVRSS
jgi:diguanylate cyclase (GGDEF)-like protein